MALVIDISWLTDVTRKMISKVESDYRVYRGIFGGAAGQPADIAAYVIGDLDVIFTQKKVCEEDRESVFTAEDRSIIATVLACLSDIVRTLGSNVSNLVKGLVHKFEASQAATAKAEKEDER